MDLQNMKNEVILDQVLIDETTRKLNERSYEVKSSVENIDTQLLIILILNYLNMMFFISQVTKIIFLNKIGRRANFPTFGFMTDTLLTISSFMTIKWILYSVKADNLAED
jgi:hypothetical protein